MLVDESQAPVPPRLRPIGPVVSQAEFGIWSEAQAALEAAERHRQRMRTWALAAYRRERQRGHDEGLAAAREEAARLVASTAARADAYLRGLERDLPQLVLDMIEDVLGSFDPGDLLARAVRHAVGKLRAGGELRLRVAPERAAFLRAALADLCEDSGAGMIQFEIDPTLAPDQCVLRSEFGNIELGLEAQIRALRQGLAADEQTGGAQVTP